MTQQTQWRIGRRGSGVAEIAQLPGARVHRRRAVGTRGRGPRQALGVQAQGVRFVGADRLTRSFPLAMDRESGEWPLHSMFGFALWDRRSRTMSLAHCRKTGKSA